MMNKKLIFSLVLSMTMAYNYAKAEEGVKCYPNAEFMKFIDEKGLVTLYNGFKASKVNEVLLSKDRHVYVVEYDKSADGNALKATNYCVISILDNVTFNDSAIEFLAKLMEKARGKEI